MGDAGGPTIGRAIAVLAYTQDQHASTRRQDDNAGHDEERAGKAVAIIMPHTGVEDQRAAVGAELRAGCIEARRR